MKSIVALLVLSASFARATLLGLVTVKQPVYLHGSDTDVEIKIVDAQVGMVTGLPEAIFSGIGLPHVPQAIGAWKPQDINVASLYKISISAESSAADALTVTIDASKAKVPEGYPFTIEQVVDAISTCVKMMQPTRPAADFKFTLKVIPKAK